MLVLDSETIRTLAPMPQLIECLRDAFRVQGHVPTRQVVEIPGGPGERLLLSMPAFDPNGAGMVKLATVSSDNKAKGLPTIQATIVVFSKTGTPVALLDGTTVTQLRTGAASALASTYLSRTDSSHLALIGTGALSPYMAMAHCAVRDIVRISVAGRSLERAGATATAIRELLHRGVEVLVAKSVEDAVATADIVSCATSSVTPVLAGKWLRPGTFIDLVGSFSRTNREADDDALLRSRIFVDTLDGAFGEAGDIIGPITRGVIDRQRIEGELADLVCGRVRGRKGDEELILFKSVGTAIEDFAAAQMIVAAATARGPNRE